METKEEIRERIILNAQEGLAAFENLRREYKIYTDLDRDARKLFDSLVRIDNIIRGL